MSGETNRMVLSYIPEVTWGTTPATTPAFQLLRFTGQSLNHNIEQLISKEISSTGNVMGMTPSMASNAGNIEGELSHATYDDFIAAALRSEWTSNVVKNANLHPSFSIERGHLDQTEFFLFKGMMIDTMALTMAANSHAQISFGFMGSACVGAGATGSSTQTAATTTGAYNTMANVGTLTVGSSVLSGVYMNNLSINIANGLRPRPGIGQASAVSIGKGKCVVTGSFTVYFENANYWDVFKAGTASDLSFVLSDTAGTPNTQTWELPNIKFTTANVEGSAEEQDVMLNMGFQALYDSSDAASIKITRTAIV